MGAILNQLEKNYHKLYKTMDKLCTSPEKYNMKRVCTLSEEQYLAHIDTIEEVSNKYIEDSSSSMYNVLDGLGMSPVFDFNHREIYNMCIPKLIEFEEGSLQMFFVWNVTPDVFGQCTFQFGTKNVDKPLVEYHFNLPEMMDGMPEDLQSMFRSLINILTEDFDAYANQIEGSDETEWGEDAISEEDDLHQRIESIANSIKETETSILEEIIKARSIEPEIRSSCGNCSTCGCKEEKKENPSFDFIERNGISGRETITKSPMYSYCGQKPNGDVLFGNTDPSKSLEENILDLVKQLHEEDFWEVDPMVALLRHSNKDAHVVKVDNPKPIEYSRKDLMEALEDGAYSNIRVICSPVNFIASRYFNLPCGQVVVEQERYPDLMDFYVSRIEKDGTKVAIDRISGSHAPSEFFSLDAIFLEADEDIEHVLGKEV